MSAEPLPAPVAATERNLLDSSYRVIRWTRSILAGHAVLVNALRLDRAAHPAWLVVATLLLVAWSVLVSVLDVRVRDARLRDRLIADVAVTALLVGTSRLILGAALSDADHLSVCVYWMVCAPMAVAVWGRLRWGLAVAFAIGWLAFAQSPSLDPHSWGMVLAIAMSAGAIGGLVGLLRQTIAERDAEHARSAALAERDRLGRIVHDGTLQVLALVEREGKSLGPKGHRLALLASAQEAKLRTLLQDRTVDLPASSEPPKELDIVTLLERHQSEVVTVSAMAGDLLMDADRARELNLAIAELIANVIKHAGRDANAWLLIEEEDGQAVISLRDNGVGMTAEQVQAARDRGRMGIVGSVLGRMKALGGSATVTSRPGRGTEWELRLPLQVP